jgi:hypothetical protein
MARIFRVKMATAMFAETLDNSEHSTRLSPQSYTLNSSRENLRTRFMVAVWYRDVSMLLDIAHFLW